MNKVSYGNISIFCSPYSEQWLYVRGWLQSIDNLQIPSSEIEKTPAGIVKTVPGLATCELCIESRYEADLLHVKNLPLFMLRIIEHDRPDNPKNGKLFLLGTLINPVVSYYNSMWQLNSFVVIHKWRDNYESQTS